MKDDSTEGLREEVERLKKALEHEKRKNRLMLQSMVDGVYTTDLDKRIVFWNEAAERITGYNAETAVGNSCRHLLAHMDASGSCLCDSACPLTKAMEKEAALIGKEVYSNTGYGSTLPVSVSCSPLRDEHGNVVGAIEVFRDISEQKRHEEQKKQFFEMVTHDLRSPLTSIIGYAELLLDEHIIVSPEQTNEYLNVIRTSSGRMAEMISDFLDMTTLDSAIKSVNAEEFVLSDLIARLVREHAGAALARDITLSQKVQPGIRPVRLDPHLVERAVSNLIGNAIKYTRDGGRVEVSASHSDSSVEISVTDNGIGIPPGEREKVFDMYHRCEGTSNIEGSGLGLSLVAAVAKAHGGSVRVEDGFEGGSRFTLSFPACIAGS